MIDIHWIALAGIGLVVYIQGISLGLTIAHNRRNKR